MSAITAGTAPCIGTNGFTEATPQYVQMGGLVAFSDLPGGDAYIEQRSGSIADAYKSSDGKFYQFPWKENPFMLYYNKAVFAKAGLDPNNPQLTTYADFLAAAKTIKAKGGVQYAVWPPPSTDWYNNWGDFYSWYIAESGKPLVSNGQPNFNDASGMAVANLWREIYADGLASSEPYTGSEAFADGKTGMAIWGSDLLPLFDKSKINYGVVPLPTTTGSSSTTGTYANAKLIEMFSACKNRGTAWEFIKFATSAYWRRESTEGRAPDSDAPKCTSGIRRCVEYVS